MFSAGRRMWRQTARRKTLDRYPVLASDVEKYRESQKEKITAAAKTTDVASVGKLLLPGGALSQAVPSNHESALLLRGPPPKEP